MVTAAENNYEIDSSLSLRPLITTLKEMVEEKRPGAGKLYASLISEVEAQPQLLQPLTAAQLQEHNELVDALLASIFPPSAAGSQALYAASAPFRMQTVYASEGFQSLFLEENNNIRVADRKTTVDISKASTTLAYNVILQKLLQIYAPITGTSVHAFTEKETGLKKYYELNLNARFVDVKVKDGFELPADMSGENNYSTEELEEKLPLRYFAF
ncbi:MAG: hypothetical protein ACO1OO_15005, partial [Flavisolibacter sp.]